MALAARSVNSGTGIDVLVDDGATGDMQVVKLAYSAAGSESVISADANGLLVNTGAVTKRIEVDSGGLTTASTSYTAGDQVGTELTFANAARVSGQGGIIVGLSVLDKPKVMSGTPAAFDFYIFTTSITGASDNSAFDDSDTDMGNLVDIIRFSTADWVSNTSNATASRSGLSIGYTCAATSLFGILVCRTNHTFFGAVTDLRYALTVVRD